MKTVKTVVAIAALASSSFSVVATQMATFQSSDKQSVQSSAQQEKNTFIISNKHVNRIVTPFKEPSLKLDNVKGVGYKKRGNVLYLSTTSVHNIGGFITEGGDESSAIKVNLVPKSVEPQEIHLEGALTQGSEVARRFEQASPRTEAIVNISTAIASGYPPVGYQAKDVNASYFPPCDQEGLTFDFHNGQFYSGGDYVVSIGIATNKTDQLIEFKENNCYEDGVVSILAFPHYKMLPNTSVEVLAMYHRKRAPVRKANKRQSLLSREAE